MTGTTSDTALKVHGAMSPHDDSRVSGSSRATNPVAAASPPAHTIRRQRSAGAASASGHNHNHAAPAAKMRAAISAPASGEVSRSWAGSVMGGRAE